MGLKLFITGAGGYLGSVLARKLADLPEVDRITGTINKNVPSEPLPDKVELIKMDVRAPELCEAMAGHDVVLHTAFIVLWPKSIPERVRDDINFNGTRNVAQAAIKNKVRKFIHASSIAAYDPHYASGNLDLREDGPIGQGHSPMYYFNSKALTEKLLMDIFSSTHTLLTLYRIPYIIGPSNQVTINEFRRNAVSFPRQDPHNQFVHEDDVCRAYELALRNELPGVFNVTPDDAIKASEIYEIIDVKPVKVPFWLGYLVAYIRWNFFGSSTHPSWVRSMTLDFAGNNDKLKAKGWAPQYRCADAIRSAL
jgi:UDP-glucose 4-epimerase